MRRRRQPSGWIAARRARRRLARGTVVFVTGGARSGKSRWSQEWCERHYQNPLYLATAQAMDKEMALRIAEHRKARSGKWRCMEEPIEIASALRHPPRCGVILVDCLTLWLSNVLLKEGASKVEERTADLAEALRLCPLPVVLVSNEVGMGIVPESKLGRDFRDMAGRLNQQVADVADAVVFMVSGIPLCIKGKVPDALVLNRSDAC